jgi:hypothetical protein
LWPGVWEAMVCSIHGCPEDLYECPNDRCRYLLSYHSPFRRRYCRECMRQNSLGQATILGLPTVTKMIATKGPVSCEHCLTLMEYRGPA